MTHKIQPMQAKTSLSYATSFHKQSVSSSPTAQRHPHSCREKKSIPPNCKPQRLHHCCPYLDCSTRMYHLAKKFHSTNHHEERAQSPTQAFARMWLQTFIVQPIRFNLSTVHLKKISYANPKLLVVLFFTGSILALFLQSCKVSALPKSDTLKTHIYIVNFVIWSTVWNPS